MIWSLLSTNGSMCSPSTCVRVILDGFSSSDTAFRSESECLSHVVKELMMPCSDWKARPIHFLVMDRFFMRQRLLRDPSYWAFVGVMQTVLAAAVDCSHPQRRMYLHRVKKKEEETRAPLAPAETEEERNVRRVNIPSRRRNAAMAESRYFTEPRPPLIQMSQ